jgi:hypothetical protein
VSRRGETTQPVPLERGRARGILFGLFAFAAGFAVAATELFLWGTARPSYLMSITIGFVGIGIAGWFLNRGTVPRPEAAIWSPTGLRAVASAVGWPAVPIMVIFYGLVAIGVLGNFVIPMAFRGN